MSERNGESGDAEHASESVSADDNVSESENENEHETERTNTKASRRGYRDSLAAFRERIMGAAADETNERVQVGERAHQRRERGPPEPPESGENDAGQRLVWLEWWDTPRDVLHFRWHDVTGAYSEMNDVLTTEARAESLGARPCDVCFGSEGAHVR